MITTLRIFIGWDSKEPISWQVAASSILRHASRSVSLVPLTLRSVAGLYTRPVDARASTEFSLTRFLVPALCGYEGLAIFIDSDVIVRRDIDEILDITKIQPGRAVYVAQHAPYVPKTATKFLGHQQASYPRKNWSSVMLFDCARCQALTVEYVNTASPADLHRFAWLPDEQIGSLSTSWNWLVGEYARNPYAALLHFTNGVPAFSEYATCDHADLWWEEYQAMLAPVRHMVAPMQETV